MKAEPGRTRGMSSVADVDARGSEMFPGRSTLSEREPVADGHGMRASESVFARWTDVADPEVPVEDAGHEHDEPVEAPEGIEDLDDAADESAHELPVDASTSAALPHREHVEQMFGASFAGVRAHVGVDLSPLRAQAAASGETVAFADARPSRELVAHEMTHVMQTRNAGAVAARGVASADSGAEREAEANEANAASGARMSATAAPAGAVHLKRAYAPTDRYNKKQRSGRPGVAVGRRQTFRVVADTKRYSFIAGAGVREFDVVTPADEITINISQPRTLGLPDGRHHSCVLARTRLGGSAWIPVDSLDADRHKLAAAARRLAGRSAPAAPRGRLKERVFKDATRSTDLSLTSYRAAQTRAQYDHYLHRTSNAEVQDGFYNVCMALPQHGKVPTALDVARPGDHFFVMQTREVPLYENGGSKRPAHYSRWAFGCMGKRAASGTWEPDRSRRGWVPLETLT